MKLRFLSALLLLGLYLPLAAQTKLTTNIPHQKLIEAKSPEAVGISPERLQRLDRVMKSFVTDNKLPGLRWRFWCATGRSCIIRPTDRPM